MMHSRRRSALSMLEVILALTVLSIAMALLGELISIGAHSGASARDLTRAQLYCESKMAEYAAGLSIPVSVSASEYETDPEWEYSVDVQPLAADGLIVVTVTVQEKVETNVRSVFYTMTRWMPDPNIDWPTTFFEDTETAEE
jgi:Tfp pilus assembly protein PilV